VKSKVLTEHRLSDAFPTPATFINSSATHRILTAALVQSERGLFLEYDTHSSYQLDLSLTRRELEVLGLVAEGYTDRKIAELLVISPRTVNRHLSNIYTKLDVPGRTAAVTCVMLQGAFAYE
jgi:DNA-binding NarL/FixJ family response regulator